VVGDILYTCDIVIGYIINVTNHNVTQILPLTMISFSSNNYTNEGTLYLHMSFLTTPKSVKYDV